jgi:hypothetical protein
MARVRPSRFGISSFCSRRRSEVGWIGCPARRPGNRKRLFGFVAVVRFERALT